MLTLDLTNAPRWYDLAPGVRVQLRPLTTALNPRPGDRIEIDGEAFLIQGEPVRDRERLVWSVDLRPA